MTTETAWAYLPNAKHIDAVLADVKARPEAWVAARSAARSAARGAARTAARSAARGAVWDAARDAAWNAARDAARGAVWGAVRVAAQGAAWDALYALIAWDSSADLLECAPDVLRAMMDLAEPPVRHQATLLLPYAVVRFGT